MNRSRTIIYTIHDMKAHFSTKARKPKKIKNHYETLNISHESTQEDIKSAYYELSKKYHPDKNTASDAKQKFQDVSDAYETLSNFNKRKLYDRDLEARGQHSRTKKVYEDTYEDPMSRSYRPPAGEIRYDFDAWTRAHYGDTLKRTIQDKKNKAERDEYKRLRQKLMAEEARREKNVITFMVFFITTVFSVQLIFGKDYDRDEVSKRKSSKS